MNLVFYSLWYNCSHEKHKLEINEARSRNLANKAFSKVVEVTATGQRHSFEDVFNLAVKEPANTICCTCNADCYYDVTIEKVLTLDLMGKFFCVTRHVKGQLNLMPWGCHDGWIWRVECTPRKFENLELGHYGVDGKLNYYLLTDGYSLENPCRDIHLHHLHADGNFGSPSRFPAYPYPLGFVGPPNRRGQTRAWIEYEEGKQKNHMPTVRVRQVVDADGKCRIESW